MGKSLYSLILSDDVVEAVDRAAMLGGTNRSAMVNRILAEYLAVETPEEKIGKIIENICGMLSGDYLTSRSPGQSAMMVKTSFAYRYRPTVRYDIRLVNDVPGRIEMNVTIRTQSDELIALVSEFFAVWIRAEAAVSPSRTGAVRYSVSGCRLTRTSAADKSDPDIAGSVTRYVRLFDSMMKAYIAGQTDAAHITAAYLKAKESGSMI